MNQLNSLLKFFDEVGFLPEGASDCPHFFLDDPDDVVADSMAGPVSFLPFESFFISSRLIALFVRQLSDGALFVCCSLTGISGGGFAAQVFFVNEDIRQPSVWIRENKHRQWTSTDGLPDGFGAMLYGLLSKVVNYINLPSHHVLVEGPARPSRKIKTAKLLRDDHRDRVILIRPGDAPAFFRGSLDADYPNGRICLPHRRRGHVRVLRSEKWGDKQGSTVFVRPAWIGPSELCANGRQYRVVAIRDKA